MRRSKKLVGLSATDGITEVVTDGVRIQMYFLKEDVVRFRATFDHFQPDASYSLILTAWPDELDEFLHTERIRIPLQVPDFLETEQTIVLTTSALRVVIEKEPFGIDIFDLQGNLLWSDLRGLTYVQENTGKICHYQSISRHDLFYGFGEKTGKLNKMGRRLRMHNTDAIGYDSETSDPLYKHIPFFIKMNQNTGIASGVFYHSTYPCTFDMGCERSGYWAPYAYMEADGGEIDWFFMAGPSIRGVVQSYTDLTGKTILPPMYSLGYMGSTMYYTELDENSDQAILGFVGNSKIQEMPCTGFHLSSGYTTGDDKKRYVFQWNQKRFPQPDNFIQEIQDQGVVLSPNVKPALLLSHPLYQEFANKRTFIAASDSPTYVPQVERFWGGPASFVDFTNPDARLLWKEYLKKSLIERGIRAIWNDNNEFEIKDMDSVCDFEGKKATVRAVRSILPNLMAKTAYEAVVEQLPNIRPYILSRSGYSGIQRYAQTWAGDNYSNWKSLRFNTTVILGIGLSGVANYGCDIGGFDGPAPEPELLVRWVQVGVFYPRFSIHSSNTDNTVTEPWMYPSYRKYIRDAIQLRYKLLPYLYSLFHEASTIGTPIMRPLVFEFQQDKQVYQESFDFLFGPSILVAPIYEKGCSHRQVYLPYGSEWIDWISRKRYPGGQCITVPVELGQIPLFIREGAIIPMKTESGVRFLIDPWQNRPFVMYEDDGESLDHLKGIFKETTISIKQLENDLLLLFNISGSYISEGTDCIEIELLCKQMAPQFISLGTKMFTHYVNPIDHEALSFQEDCWHFNGETDTAYIRFKKPSGDFSIRVGFSQKDLINI